MNEMNWQIISIVCFSLSGLFLLLNIIIFFKANIMKTIGFLSGSTVKKEKSRINKKNKQKLKEKANAADNDITLLPTQNLTEETAETAPLDTPTNTGNTEKISFEMSFQPENTAQILIQKFEIIKNIVVVHTDEVL